MTKYVILLIGYAIIWATNRDNLKDAGGYLGGIASVIPMFLWMAFTIVWLIIFFVFNLDFRVNIND